MTDPQGAMTAMEVLGKLLNLRRTERQKEFSRVFEPLMGDIQETHDDFMYCIVVLDRACSEVERALSEQRNETDFGPLILVLDNLFEFMNERRGKRRRTFEKAARRRTVLRKKFWRSVSLGQEGQEAAEKFLQSVANYLSWQGEQLKFGHGLRKPIRELSELLKDFPHRRSTAQVLEFAVRLKALLRKKEKHYEEIWAEIANHFDRLDDHLS